MASFLPPIDTLSLDHTGASPTTLVVDDGIGSMFKDVKGDFPTAADSAITEDPERNVPSPSKANFGLVPKPEGEEVAGTHGRLRLKISKADESGNVPETTRTVATCDMSRKEMQAYEYMCYKAAAMEWMELMIGESIEVEDINELDEACQRGVILAKLAKSFCPQVVNKIFTGDKLCFRHSDNIYYLFKAMREVGLPEYYLFELTDAYDMKNIPKVIFAIHSLSHFLAKKGIAPRIRDLRGELSFTEEQLRTQGERLDESGLPLPSFGSIESSLAKEVKEPTQEEKWNLQYRSQQAEIALIQALWRAKVARRAFLVDIEVYRQEQLLKKQREEEQLRRQLLEKQRRDAEQQEARERERAHRLAMEQRDAMRRQKESEERARDDAARKIQNWMRALKARELESMRTLSDPALATVRKYLYLADSTNADFAEEAELEELRHQVIRAIRLNSISETELRDLETKISLLIRNKVTLDEVVHTTTKQYRERSTHERDGAGALGDIFAMRALDTESRHKLEGYQSLFYVLQTQPVYLGKLMFLLNRKWGAAFNNFVEGVVMALFGYAQQAREEYMLLQLIKTAIQFEVKEAKEINDITKAQPFYVRLLLHYTRAPGQRKYLQQTLQPLIKEVIEAADLDLDTDPLSIYRATIRDQETKSGEKSTKPFNLSDAKEALADEDTRNRFTKNVMALQSLTKHFLDQLVDSLDHLPYGIRYIISELRRQLNGKFPGQTKEVDAALGNVLYYRFINPAVCAPEEYDVLTGVNIDTTQRRNLAEVGKLLNIIQNGKVSSADMVQSMLSDFLETSTHRFRDFVAKACDVSSPEDFFQIDEYQDLTAKPTIAITSNEIYQVHSMLVENVDDLVSGRKDPLAVVLQELGPAPPIGSTLDRDRSKTVALTLTNRHVVLSAEAREMSRVWAETKQLVAEVLATNRAKNLVDLLEKPTTENDEARFRQWQAGRNGTSRDSLKAIKKKALDNISVLEAAKKCKRANNYQEIVTAIAQDINMKTKRRTQRQQELVRIRQTLISLQERSKYLDEQKKSFNDYIASCMAQLSSKKRSPKKAPLFSRQWMHARNLEKSGRMPRFGSYKFTAEELRAKGVLVGVEGYTPKQFGGMTLVISSNQPGVFLIDCTYLGVKLAEQMELRIEELLQQQNEGVQVITLFDAAKVNVNLLLFLLNKKFFA